jgi:uncharacterized protein YecT (DUF1311 family)
MWARRTLLCLFAFALADDARAASLNCAKAQTEQEKAICASPELSAEDDHMAAQYRETLRVASPDAATVIRESQRRWAARMPRDCPAGDSAMLTTCLLADERNRADALKHMTANLGGVVFFWRSVSFTVPDSPDTEGLMQAQGQPSVGSLDASWPEAMSKAPEWIAWNRAIEMAARDVAGANSGGGSAWDKDWAQDMDIDVNVGLEIVTDRLVTATVTNNWYGHGAAHPNTTSIEFNWLFKAQRELKPLDVFRFGSGWDAVLQQICDRDLHKKLDGADGYGGSYDSFMQPGLIQKTLHDIVMNPENWRVDKDGVAIIYQTYAVASRVATPEPTEIPWSELKPYLNLNFAIPAN